MPNCPWPKSNLFGRVVHPMSVLDDRHKRMWMINIRSIECFFIYEGRVWRQDGLFRVCVSAHEKHSLMECNLMIISGFLTFDGLLWS